ncbi:MAG: hypothetical protein ABI623_04715 [bacterium]
MSSKCLCILIVAVIASSNVPSMKSQSLATRNLDSLARLYNTATSKLTSSALEERKRLRKEMQRTGYANVVMDIVGQNSFSALISFIKVKLLIEYSISHRPLTISVPIAGGKGGYWVFALPDDWRFPVDPWEKK